MGRERLTTCGFFITAYSIGCYKDTGRRAIQPLEGRSRLLKGHYRKRWDAIRKCALAAERRRYKVFAVQHGGWCASARRAHLTYGRYGKSNRCRNGKGGPWANSVYVLRGQYFPTIRHYTYCLTSQRHSTLTGSFSYRPM